MSGLKYEAKNEPLLEFLSGSQERKGVEEAIQKYSKVVTDIPIVIGEEEIRNDQPMFQVAVSICLPISFAPVESIRILRPQQNFSMLDNI